MTSEKYADKLRKSIPAKTEAVISEKDMTAAQIQYDSIVEVLNNGGMDQIFTDSWQSLIDEANESGIRQIEIPIATNQGQNFGLTTVEQAIMDIGIEFLRAEGFTANRGETHATTLDQPAQSADHTNIFIRVSW